MSLSFSMFDRVSGIRYGMSERSDGSLRLNQPCTEQNRRAYLEPLDIPFESLVSADLVHKTHIHVAQAVDTSHTILACDGFVTAETGITLTVTGADCFPVFVVDPVRRVIGIVHAGWKGIAAGIVSKLVQEMEKLGATKENLLFGIGPGIRACHFEVKEDVSSVFPDKESIHNSHIDLPASITRQLETLGIARTQIEDCGLCTACLSDRYFSYRRDKPEIIEAMMAYIRLDK
ncbi:MAG: polyphenol oxidase family protein [Candidatus Uhrbacteria bacterium]